MFRLKLGILDFKKELKAQETLEGILKLFAQLIESDNILRLHQKNIWDRYGDTDSFKSAIMDIARSACLFKPTPDQKFGLSILKDKLVAIPSKSSADEYNNLINTLKDLIKDENNLYTFGAQCQLNAAQQLSV